MLFKNQMIFYKNFKHQQDKMKFNFKNLNFGQKFKGIHRFIIKRYIVISKTLTQFNPEFRRTNDFEDRKNEKRINNKQWCNFETEKKQL